VEFSSNASNAGSSKAIGIGFVVVLHVLVLWALANGLAHKVVELLPPPIETKLLEEQKAEEPPPPPPPPPDFQPPPPPSIPPPEINIAAPAAPVATTITATTKPPPPAPPPPAPVQREPVTVAPVVKAANCRPPEYPAISERLGEAGSVVVAMLVGTDGKVSDSRVQTSSGYPRLDEAARKGLSRCRFTPGTVDGQPAAAWAQMKYTFKPAN